MSVHAGVLWCLWCCVRVRLCAHVQVWVCRFAGLFFDVAQLLGYKIPGCTHLREPRPWQLPGWKSPWMLKRAPWLEFDNAWL